MILRIVTDIGSFDWELENSLNITFREVLEAMNQVLPDVSVTAFEYDDEDGDRITVRTDAEMSAMLAFQKSSINETNLNLPFNIYPKYNKSCEKNVFGLKVEVSGTSHNPAPTLPPVDYRKDTEMKAINSSDLNEIMSCGNVSAADLQEIEVFGKGASGIVYRALHILSGCEMAVKTIALDATQDEQRRIIAELEILYKCNSPNIIGFYGAFFVENRISICTEYMNGCSLDRYGQIEESILGPVAVSIIEGISYLSGLKIMHRDVKPSNILVNTKGEIKLCDFGVSTQLVNSIAQTYIGSNGYMAPERINAQGYDIKSEVWSIGVSVFEMALGKFPYHLVFPVPKEEIKLMELLTFIVTKPPPLRLLRAKKCSNELIDFIAVCLQKQPENRPCPNNLKNHCFLEKYLNFSPGFVADWVTSKMFNLQMTVN
ncbi:DgyrCDS10946 [Dimorphilus gyrociliatus]|uniref:mitogen-activated protein kinase kinase n=1 Tax=Dimorphilus gyrociliatus TaxID=2664684 RepID=A0A7I8W1V9_9ANNE|nr:DgyrCDS10946 [Dimorphilus gyrociliatus]